MGFKDSLGYKTFSKKKKRAASHVNKMIMGKRVLSASAGIMELPLEAVAGDSIMQMEAVASVLSCRCIDHLVTY